MIFSIMLSQKNIEVEVDKENEYFPIKVWLSDITISLSKEEALELGSKLEQAYQDLNHQVDGDV